jgi:hypothetical protein
VSTADHVPEGRIHRPETEETAEDDGDAVTRPFHDAWLGSVSTSFPCGVDPATMSVRAVARGHVPPDLIVVRVRSGNKLKTPRAWPVPPPTAPTLNRRLGRVRKTWSSPTSQLLCNRVPELEQRPRLVNVYTDASTAPGSSFAAIGLVCPELSMITSGVLPRARSRQNLDISAAELTGVAAAAPLFDGFADTVVIHSDSVAAVAWWASPAADSGLAAVDQAKCRRRAA